MGILYAENHSLRTSIIFAAVVDNITRTSGHLEWVSTPTRNISPWKGPVMYELAAMAY